MGERIESFRELRAYGLAFELQQMIFETTKAFPREECYALTDQIRRASRSIGANVAEAWQKRRYLAHFVNKLTDADAENAETQHWLDTGLACKYLTLEEHAKLEEASLTIGKMLGSMLANAESFCQSSEDR